MTTAQRIESLQDQGFDNTTGCQTRDGYGRFDGIAIRPRCSQCEACCINGVACHEQRCPNIPRYNDNED